MLAHTLPWPCEHLVVIGCKKHLISNFLLQTCEIDLFAYHTLPKRPAEIALPGREWQQVKSYLIWTENTLEPSNWLKIL